MQVGVLKETFPGENRVAVTPASMKTLKRLNVDLVVESGAGVTAGISDADYEAAGASIASRDDIIEKSEIIAMVRAAIADPDNVDVIGRLRTDQSLIAQCDPLSDASRMSELAADGPRMFALELVPRITRAQSMDVLSSMASLAGYKAVLLGATALPKQFPMMMTAAGTVKPARVFVIGAGVAGLQAIATAKRLGAVVSATDVRPAVKEQVESLGGRFVDTTTVSGEGSGGYAKALDEDAKREQRELVKNVLRESDVVITTAAVPGKKAPTLLTAEMIDVMPAGSVIVDLAAERGGNCELTKPGETVEVNGVTILGPENIPSTLARDASLMYSNNLTTFLKEIVIDGKLTIDLENEVVAGTLVSQNGEVVHPFVRELAGLPALEKQSEPEPQQPESIPLSGDDDGSSDGDGSDS